SLGLAMMAPLRLLLFGLSFYNVSRKGFTGLFSDHSSASINVYQDIMPRPIEPAAIEEATHKLMSMPLDILPGASSLPLGSRPPAYARNRSLKPGTHPRKIIQLPRLS